MSIICTKASEIAKRLDDKTAFKPTKGWFSRFVNRFDLTRHGLHGEASSADLISHKNKIAELQKLMSDYTPDSVFNMDETGLFFKARPTHLYMDRKVACNDIKGHKETHAKSRVTLVLASNSTGFIYFLDSALLRNACLAQVPARFLVV